MSIQHAFTQFVDRVQPTVATFFGATAVSTNAMVLFDQIRGVAALITVLLGVPTAALVLIYWAIKVWRAIKQLREDERD